MATYGIAAPNLLAGAIDVPLIVVDKATLHITLRNAYVEGFGFIPYTDCEIYMPIGDHSNLGRAFKGNLETKKVVTEAVIYVLHPLAHNYYHALAECLTRIALALEYFGRNGILDRAHLLLPERKHQPIVSEFLDIIAPKLKRKPVTFIADSFGRTRFSELHMLDYHQLSDDIDQNDLWSQYVPARVRGSCYCRD